MTTAAASRSRGIVQGVGFRPWVYRLAREHGVGGRVRNDAARRHHRRIRRSATLDALHRSDSPHRRRRRRTIRDWRSARDSRASGPDGFVIDDSAAGRERRDLDSRRISRPAPTAWPRSSTRATGGIAMRSRTAPTAGPASRSPPTCPTTARHDAGGVHDVRGLPARIRHALGSALSRAAQCLSRVRPGLMLLTATAGPSMPTIPSTRSCACCAPDGSSRSRGWAASISPAMPRPPPPSPGCGSASVATRSHSPSWFATSRRRRRWRC